MATITEAVVTADNLQAHNGLREIRFRFNGTDNNGDPFSFRYGPVRYGIAWDRINDAGGLNEIQATVLDRMALREERGIAEEILLNGLDSLARVQSPKFATDKALAKSCIRYMMRERGAEAVIAFASLLDYLRVNYNAAQLRSFLDVDNTTLTKINNKISAVLDDTPAGASVIDQIAIIEANSEDVEHTA